VHEALRSFVGMLTALTLFGAVVGALCGWSLVGWALWPTHSRAVRDMLHEAFARALLVGTLNLLACFALAALLKSPPVAVLLAIGIAVITLSGVSGLGAFVGQRMAAAAGLEAPLLRAAGTGMLTVGVAALLPVAGQVFGIAMLVAAFGAGIMAVLARKE